MPTQRHLVCSVPLLFCLAVTACDALKSIEPGDKSVPEAGPAASIPPIDSLPTPDKAILALLDGLKVGDRVGQGKVLAIGAVNAQGGIPINVLLERQGLPNLGLQIVVHLKTEDPPAPFFSAKYGVFYQSLGALQAPMPDDFRVMINEIVERLKRTEDKVPVPGGLGPAKKPGKPA